MVTGGDGQLIYTPEDEYSGTDSFLYVALNEVGDTSRGEINIVVRTYCDSYTQTAAFPFVTGYTPVPDGTLANPFRICTQAQMTTLQGTTANYDKYYFLMQDIMPQRQSVHFRTKSDF